MPIHVKNGIVVNKGGIRVGSDGEPCCCEGGVCWIRWQAVFDCSPTITDDFKVQYTVIDTICSDSPPEYAGTGWTLIYHYGPKCIWRYDQKLPDNKCGVDGDCPTYPLFPPDGVAPDIGAPDSSVCCCMACLYVYEVVYTKLTMSFGDVAQISSNCFDLRSTAISVTGNWKLIGQDATTCTYRAYVLVGCCSGDSDCDSFPDPPALPNPATCKPCTPPTCARFLVTLIAASPRCDQLGRKGRSTVSGAWTVDCNTNPVAGSQSVPAPVDYYMDGTCTDLQVPQPGPAIPTQGNVIFTYGFYSLIGGLNQADVAIISDDDLGVFSATPIIFDEFTCCPEGPPLFLTFQSMFEPDFSDGSESPWIGGTVTVELLNCPT